MSLIKVLAVFGTRPEAIKMAPVVQCLAAMPQDFAMQVAVTAQHREMLDQVLQLFAIHPTYDLNIMQPRQTLAQITCRALAGLDEVLEREQPQVVLVHGDTTTTFAASLAAFYHQIAVGHVEAGLRTGQRYVPFPEEMNRRLTGAIASLHFAPTASARDNLLQEGVGANVIYVTGNTVIDALLATVAMEYNWQGPLDQVCWDRRVLLVTCHRRENWGEPMAQVFWALRDLVEAYSQLEVVFPVHMNPLVRGPAEQILGGLTRVHLVDPLDYLPFVQAMARSYLVLTDSGGLQEEAPSLGKPVLVLRAATERPEAVLAGTVNLVGTQREAIVRETSRLLDDNRAYQSMSRAINPYGDGQAAGRIAQALKHAFGRSSQRPDDFQP